MVDRDPEGNEYSLAQVFPGSTKEEAVQKVKQVKAWLQSLPLAKRPLVKVRLQHLAQLVLQPPVCLLICHLMRLRLLLVSNITMQSLPVAKHTLVKVRLRTTSITFTS